MIKFTVIIRFWNGGLDGGYVYRDILFEANNEKEACIFINKNLLCNEEIYKIIKEHK